MDCRKFKDLIDSYLCGELLVETNHEVLRHSEHCPDCRAEMAARRDFREKLKRAGTRIILNEEARQRMQQHFREQVLQTKHAPSFFHRFFSGLPRPRLLLAGAMGILLVTVSVLWMNRSSQPVQAAELSETLLREAAREHEICTFHYKDAPEPQAMKPNAVEYDPIFTGLEKVAKRHAAGMQLRLAHFCNLVGRDFIHLGFTKGDGMASLLVTRRDARAMKNGMAPTDDGLRTQVQTALLQEYHVVAYQTAKYIVLVVSSLPEAESRALAEQIAPPICVHLRRLE
jgi:hypothetical protein